MQGVLSHIISCNGFRWIGTGADVAVSPSEKLIDLLIEMFTTHNERILLDDARRAGEWGKLSRGSVCGPRRIWPLKLRFI